MKILTWLHIVFICDLVHTQTVICCLSLPGMEGIPDLDSTYSFLDLGFLEHKLELRVCRSQNWLSRDITPFDSSGSRLEPAPSLSLWRSPANRNWNSWLQGGLSSSTSDRKGPNLIFYFCEATRNHASEWLGSVVSSRAGRLQSAQRAPMPSTPPPFQWHLSPLSFCLPEYVSVCALWKLHTKTRFIVTHSYVLPADLSHLPVPSSSNLHLHTFLQV